MNSSLRNIMNSWEPWHWNELSRYEAVHQVWLVFSAFSASSHTPVLSFKRTIVFYAPHCFHLSLTESRQTRTKETSCSVTRNLSSSNTFAFESFFFFFFFRTIELDLYELIYIACVSWRSPWRQWNKSEDREHLELVVFERFTNYK